MARLKLCPLVLALAPAPALATVWYVDAGAPPGGAGTSWNTALRELSAALTTASSGDEVRVAVGVYRPAPPGGSRDASFVIPGGVWVRGRFAGRASPTPDARVPGGASILSGDLNGNDAGAANRADNAFHVVRSAGTGSRLEEFTITAGTGESGLTLAGAGLIVTAGTLAVSDCVLTDNSSPFAGGGAGVAGGSPTFTRCTFTQNRTSFVGGGLFTAGPGTPVISDCVFRSNEGGIGAGLANTGPCRPIIQRCTVDNNRGVVGSVSGPGAADLTFSGTPGAASFLDSTFTRNTSNAGGGGVFVQGSTTTIRRCQFVQNEAKFDGGGGVYVDSGSADVSDSRFVGNITSAGGAAVFVAFQGSAQLTNCSIASNGRVTQPASFSAVIASGGHLSLRNSIVWNNIDTQSAGLSAQVMATNGGQITFTNDIIQHWTGTFNGAPVPVAAGISGADPLFRSIHGADQTADTDDDDLRLLPGSPGVNAGSLTWLPTPITTDLAGGPRVVCGAVDLGAFERPNPADVSDIGDTGAGPDGQLTADDIIAFVNTFSDGVGCPGPAPCCLADVTDIGATPAGPDGQLTVDDVIAFVNAFNDGC